MGTLLAKKQEVSSQLKGKRTELNRNRRGPIRPPFS